jgi:membrane fusion protein, multidrug efflux system
MRMSSIIERPLVGAVFSAALLALTGCSQQKGTATIREEKPIVLGAQDVALANRTRLTTGVVLTGSLAPAWQVSVKAQVPGTITRLVIDRGSRVKQGQLLATIDAEGIRGSAAGARAAVASAQAGAAVAQQRLESARALHQAGAISAIDLKTAEANHEAAAAQVAAAQAQAAGALEQARRANVRAPISGVVSSRVVQQGEAVSSGDDLFTVVRSDVLELSGEVPVDAAAQIRPGQAVVFTLSAEPGREYRGEVARIEPMANPATRQVGVYLRMRNPGNLIGGQFATGRVLGGTASEVIAIPETAVRQRNDSTFVFVVSQGVATRRAVTVGQSDPATGVIVVRNGLAAGEQVIVTPSAAIADGARVQVAAVAEPAPRSTKANPREH